MSTRRRTVAAATALVALVALAGFAALLAIDLVRVDRHLARADVRYAAGDRAGAVWLPDTLLPTGLSTWLLDVDDDILFRRTVQEFWASSPRAQLRSFEDVTKRARSERALAELVDTDTRNERRSALATMRGALLLEEARNSPAQREVFVRRAIEQFRQAVRFDTRNDDALRNLELSLKLLRLSGSGDPGGGDSPSPLPSPGAGAATSGSGF